MSLQSAEEIIKAFCATKVAVIGDVMIDRYIYGKVDRMSPETEVPVVKRLHEEVRLGGAGNVALNLRALGAQVNLFGVIGEDDSGKAFCSLLETQQIKTDFIHIDPYRPTTEKVRILDGSKQVVRVDHEIEDPISEQIQELILRDLDSMIDSIDVLIFQDYNKGVLEKSLIERVIAECTNKGALIVVDPKERNFDCYKGVSLLKPNLRELETYLGHKINAGEGVELEVACKEVMDTLKCETLLLTLSDQGVFVIKGDETWEVPGHMVKTPDVSGAGDTVVAVTALTLASNANPHEIAKWSNLAGALVCGRAGVVAIDPVELQQEFNRLYE